jgi:hypothetical protein
VKFASLLEFAGFWQFNEQEICMLVRFDSDVGTLTMFDEVAVQLLKSMGHTGAVPSAILPEDIPAAVERLKAALAGQPDAAANAHGQAAGDDENELPISIKQRAFPLIELLERAAKRKCEVVWR